MTRRKSAYDQSLPALSVQQIESLNKLDPTKPEEYKEVIGSLTPRQLNEYLQWADRNTEVDYMVWDCSTEWGFETWWCRLRLSNHKQYRATLSRERLEIPPTLKDLTPDKPLREHEVWHQT
jgi:hypothetical protein